MNLLKPSKKSKLIVSVTIVLLFSIVAGMTTIHKAKHKDFWFDEIYEIFSTCEMSMEEIFLANTTLQSNRNFLYYVPQKLVLSNIKNFGPQVLVEARTISIISLILIVFGIFVHIQNRNGLFWASFTLLCLMGQNLFYHYAAENRPYLFWLLIFTFMVFLTVELCLRPYDQCRIRSKVLFFISTLFITLVIATGVMQSVVAVLTCLLVWYFVHERPKNWRPFTHFALPILVITCGIEMYFVLQGVDANESYIVNSPLDLIWRMQQGDFSLLKMPPRILLPKVPRDAYIGAYLANLFVIAGMVLTLGCWKKRKDLDKKDFCVFILGLVVTVQVLNTIFMMGAIGYLRYWFVQRIFLHLVICHALLAMVGAYLLVRLKPKILKPIMMGVGVFMLTASLLWHRSEALELEESYTKAECEPIAGALEYTFTDQVVYKDTSRVDAIINIGKRLNQCGWAGNQDVKRVYVWEDTDNVMHVGPEIPPDGKPSEICSRQIYFDL